MQGIAHTETYRSAGIKIVQTGEEQFTRATGFNYEFVCYVDGKLTMTAKELEQRGESEPWVPALTRYAEAYIDGRDD